MESFRLKPFDVDKVLSTEGTLLCCRYSLITPMAQVGGGGRSSRPSRATTELIHVLVAQELNKDEVSLRFITAFAADEPGNPGFELDLDLETQNTISRQLTRRCQQNLLYLECPDWLGVACPHLIPSETFRHEFSYTHHREDDGKNSPGAWAA